MTDFTFDFCYWLIVIPVAVGLECILATFNAYWDEEEKIVKSRVRYRFVWVCTAILSAFIMALFYDETYMPIICHITGKSDVSSLAIFGFLVIGVFCFSGLLAIYDVSFAQEEANLEYKNTR